MFIYSSKDSLSNRIFLGSFGLQNNEPRTCIRKQRAQAAYGRKDFTIDHYAEMTTSGRRRNMCSKIQFAQDWHLVLVNTNTADRMCGQSPTFYLGERRALNRPPLPDLIRSG